MNFSWLAAGDTHPLADVRSSCRIARFPAFRRPDTSSVVRCTDRCSKSVQNGITESTGPMKAAQPFTRQNAYSLASTRWNFLSATIRHLWCPPVPCEMLLKKRCFQREIAVESPVWIAIVVFSCSVVRFRLDGFSSPIRISEYGEGPPREEIRIRRQ